MTTTATDYALCQNPAIRHRWDIIPIAYVPDTTFPYIEDSFSNKRCERCGLIAACMADADGNTYTLYQESTRPPGYFYAEDDRPTAADFRRMMRIHLDEVGRRQRRRLRAAS